MPSYVDNAKASAIHDVDGLSDSSLLERLRAAIHEPKLLPLPALAPPAPYSGRSAGVRQRHNHKLALWRKATALASALSWLCGPSNAHTPAATLQEMKPHHRSAWQRLLGAASSFHDALRSESDEALRTGGQSLELLLKRPINEYNLKSTYVPTQADLIAEPSSPKGVDMLSVLPPASANFYSSEANVLCQDVDANRRAVLRRLGEKVGGPFSEYLR